MKKPIIILIVLTLIIGIGYLSELIFGQPVTPSGRIHFINLFDVPATYDSQAGKGVRVNTAMDALEFFTLSLGDFDNQTAWRIFYSNTDGDITELALGTNGQYLKSNGASSVPSWSTIAGGGDLLADGTVPLTANWDVGNFDITLKGLTGDGTIEGATLTEGGTGVYNTTESDAAYQPLEATLTDIADGTINENLVNTANPWADNEVADNITIDLATLATTLTITDNESTAENNPIVFVAGADPDGGNLGLETDGNLHYNPSTGTATSTEFSGGGGSLTGIDAATGDSATAFFDTGTIEHERGGLEADINAYTGLVAITGGATAEVDSKAELEGHIADVADFAEADGDTWTGVHDFGGATSLEIPNTAGDVTCDAIGEIAVDSTQNQLVVNDGTEKAIRIDRTLWGPLNLADWYDIDSDLPLLPGDSTDLPDGIIITSWEIDCSVADPTTELDANLMYCDDPAAGAFPGGNAVLVDVLDTTTGNSTEADMSNSDLGNGVIPAGKFLYMDMDADPTDANTFWFVKIKYYIPES